MFENICRTKSGKQWTFACVIAVLAALGFQPVLAGVASAQGVPDPVLLALSNRDMTATAPELEQLAGGQDALVAKLLAYRTTETPPFVGIRAEKLLLLYAARSDVKAALESDIGSAKYLGLARIVAVHLDTVPDSVARQVLAKQVIARAKTDADYMRYAKTLQSSSDAEVSKMAKDALP
jgi:hypothetical protein